MQAKGKRSFINNGPEIINDLDSRYNFPLVSRKFYKHFTYQKLTNSIPK